ncbi:MAG: hypothetical protein IIY76_03830, partial [Erysipelotrichaceae bacterium]|nr:hypothetical protein [Erysipelotrichaceae bacterium]
MIASIGHVKKVMGELRAKKKFGQNFLIDANIVERIAKGACNEDLKTIEIGPGLGALTEMLLKYSKSVDAYEIDPDMYEILLRSIEDERLQVFLGDFLDQDLSGYKEKEPSHIINRYFQSGLTSLDKSLFCFPETPSSV